MKHIKAIITFVYLFFDLIFLSLAFFVPYFTYYHRLPFEFRLHLLIYTFWIMATILLFHGSQLYFTIRELGIWRESRRVIRAFLFSTLLTILFLFFLKIQTFSRLVIIENILAALTVLTCWRIAKRFFVSYLVARGFNNWSILIIGAGRVGKRFADMLHRRPELGFRVAGFLDDFISEGTIVRNHAVLGKVTDFEAVARRHFIDQVFVTIPSERNLVSAVGFHAKLLGITMQIIPDDFGFDGSEIQLHALDGMPLLEYHRAPLNYRMIIVKRMMDVLVSSIALVVLAPFFLFVALAIELDSEGPVFYVSKRWGRRGRLFNCYKFRSMIREAEGLRSQLQVVNEMDGPVFKIKDDPRVTRIGKWLRKYSIDELPQLWNVFKGDMSLVGPRPLPEQEEVGEYKLEYLNRLSIKPGLTCLWQIRGRNQIPFKRWMKLDEYYIRKWSAAMDVKILLKTVPAVLKGKGAY